MLVNHQARNLVSSQIREAPASRVFLCLDLCPRILTIHSSPICGTIVRYGPFEFGSRKNDLLESLLTNAQILI